MKNRNKKILGIIIILAIIAAAVALLTKNSNLFFYAKRAMFSKPEAAEVCVADVTGKLRKLDLENDTDFSIGNALLLVNRDYGIKEGYFTPNITEYKDTGVYMDGEVSNAFSELSAAVSESCGSTLYISSSYRTEKEQLELYENDPKTAAAPGESEHETGLALDIYVSGYAGYGFVKSEAGEFVALNCAEYGFVIRYDLFKESVTGFPYEPWHIRYVGLPHSEIMYRNSLCLEEYIESLRPGVFYSFDGWYILRETEDMLYIPEQAEDITVSPDNTGYYIVTFTEQPETAY